MTQHVKTSDQLNTALAELGPAQTQLVFENYQAQPKVQTKASAFGWDGYNIIIIQPPTHPDKYEGDEIEQNLENESCLSVWVDPKNEPCPNLKKPN